MFCFVQVDTLCPKERIKQNCRTRGWCGARRRPEFDVVRSLPPAATTLQIAWLNCRVASHSTSALRMPTIRAAAFARVICDAKLAG